MKVVIINKSDTIGGAAVVSHRLLQALIDRGIEVHMLVVDKHRDSAFVQLAGKPAAIRRAFLAERLKIFLANGMNRETLFKVDIASDGLPLHRNRLVREADVICLNWVNQGMLSLAGVREILKLGKPVIWTMHDMWNFTGICHHAGDCQRWKTNCGLCPFLGKNARPDDLSFKVWNNKKKVYPLPPKVHFVAVSNWLADLARSSSLLADAPLSVIPNAFPIPENLKPTDRKRDGEKQKDFRVVIGAARLDDPVKGLPILVETTKLLSEKYPEEASRMELVTFGAIKNPAALDGLGIRHRHLGVISGEENIRKVYRDCDAVVSTSLYETLPGTLVEGEVYGCIPVSFGRGGQRDIIDHFSTGYIAEWSDDLRTAATNIADGLVWAMNQKGTDIRERMLESARSRFSAPSVADRYIALFKELLRK